MKKKGTEDYTALAYTVPSESLLPEAVNELIK